MRRRTLIIAASGVLIGSGLIMLWLLSFLTRLPEPTGGAGSNQTTVMRSATLTSDADKIAFLQQYLKLPSPVAATEFQIIYHDNSGGGVPGPSDWDIKAVFKVAPADLPRWTDHMQQVAAGEVDLDWGYALLPDEARWAVTSQPVLYTGAGEVVAVFEREGIVFKHIWTT